MSQVELLRDREQARELIEGLVDDARRVLELPSADRGDISVFRDDYLNWEEKARTVLQTTFKTSGMLSSGPYEDFSAAGMQLLDLRITNTALPPERIPEVQSDLRERVRVLGSILDRLDLYGPDEPKASAKAGDAIFLVHGRNLERREVVR